MAYLGGYQDRTHDLEPGHQLEWHGYDTLTKTTLGHRIGLEIARQQDPVADPQPTLQQHSSLLGRASHFPASASLSRRTAVGGLVLPRPDCHVHRRENPSILVIQNALLCYEYSRSIYLSIFSLVLFLPVIS